MHPGVIAFWTGAVLAAYILAGYPLLLAILARFPAPAIQRRPGCRPVTILLPVHNGARWIRRKLESLLRLDYPRHLVQIIVISDGSTDDTERIVSEFAADGIELLSVPRCGKPAALNAGIQRATGEIVFFTDVRQPVDPACLASLVECLNDPSVGAVTGRYIVLDGETNEEASVNLYWRFEWWIRRQLNRASSLLVVTGCVYAMRRELVVPIPEDILVDDAYLPISALLRGYRIYYDERAKVYDYPTALDTEFQRKIRTLAGLLQLVGHFPVLLLPVYRQWGHFLSYKFARLLLPYALLLMFAGSFALPGAIGWYTGGAQAAAYALAALDPLIPERWRMKRISSLARTFSALMLATICAARVFFVPARHLWRPTTNVRPANSRSRSAVGLD